jgi:hypothetical protein
MVAQRRRRTMKTVAQVAGLLAILQLVACGNVKPDDWNYPRPNPRPTKILLLHGTIDAALDIHFRIDWIASNPECRYAFSMLGPAYFQYTAWNVLPITREGTKFSYGVPIDGVLPGRCQWVFAGVSFAGRTGHGTLLIARSSYPMKPGESPNGVIDLHCVRKPWQVGNQPPVPTLDCHQPLLSGLGPVTGGTLWWHPEATDLEVHISAD